MDVSHFSINHYESTSSAGVFTFPGTVTTLRNGSANQFNSFGQFLLGLPSAAVTELLPFDDNRITSRQLSYSFYLQDPWQATRKLTLSYGVRWDYFPMGVRKTRGLELSDFNPNQTLIFRLAN